MSMARLLEEFVAWSSHPFWSQASHVALQFLWQASGLTALLLLLERRSRPAEANVRYRRAVATLLAVAVAPCVTLAMRSWSVNEVREAPSSSVDVEGARDGSLAREAAPFDFERDDETASALFTEPSAPQRKREEFEATSVVRSDASALEFVSPPAEVAEKDVASSDPEIVESSTSFTGDDALGSERLSDSPERRSLSVPWWFLPAATSLWLAGVAFSLGRLALGLWTVRRWTRHSPTVGGRVLATAERLAERLRLRRLPPIHASERTAEPLAAGLFSQRVFLPAAWLGEASDVHLEAVLAHELAHIRRGDLSVNLLQRLIESLWFFHPAVWWLTRRVRQERELCCDREAVAATGNPLAYAAALEFVVERALAARRPGGATGMGDDSMAVLRRVKAVLGAPSDQPRTSWWRVGLLSAAVPAGLWLGSVSLIPASAEDGKDRPPARAEEDERPPARFDDDEEDRPREPRRDNPPPREGGPRREGDRPPREGDRPPPGPREGGPNRREGGPGPREGGPREGGPGPREGGPRPPHEELMQMIRELQKEVHELRREVREMRGGHGPGPQGRGGDGPRDPDRRRPDEVRGPDEERRRPEGDRDRPRPEGREGFRPPRDGGPREEGPRRDGDRRPEGGPRDGDRRPPEGERRPPAPPREGDRKPGDNPPPPREGERKPVPPREAKPDQPPRDLPVEKKDGAED